MKKLERHRIKKRTLPTGTISSNPSIEAGSRNQERGERIPTEESPHFAIRCVCGGIVGGVFPVIDVLAGGRLVRQRVIRGVQCSMCDRTYTVEWPERPESTR